MMLALAALLALPLGPAPGGQDPQYDTLLLETGVRTDRVEARDLNGDGKPDLILQNGRDLQVFLQKNGGFNAKPQQVLRVDPTVFLWTFGTLDGQAHPAVLTAGSRGIQA